MEFATIAVFNDVAFFEKQKCCIELLRSVNWHLATKFTASTCMRFKEARFLLSKLPNKIDGKCLRSFNFEFGVAHSVVLRLFVIAGLY